MFSLPSPPFSLMCFPPFSSLSLHSCFLDACTALSLLLLFINGHEFLCYSGRGDSLFRNSRSLHLHSEVLRTNTSVNFFIHYTGPGTRNAQKKSLTEWTNNITVGELQHISHSFLHTTHLSNTYRVLGMWKVTQYGLSLWEKCLFNVKNFDLCKYSAQLFYCS